MRNNTTEREREEVLAGCGHWVWIGDAGCCGDCGEYICSMRGFDGACSQDCDVCDRCAAKRGA